VDRNVFVIKPPSDTAPTKYFVIVYRSGGPFGAGRPTVIGVDSLVNQGTYYQGLAGDEVVVQFPSDVSYLLIQRSLVDAMTSVDAAKQQKEEDAELEKILGPEKESAASGWSDGTYR
jgi:hypothetical protein